MDKFLFGLAVGLLVMWVVDVYYMDMVNESIGYAKCKNEIERQVKTDPAPTTKIFEDNLLRGVTQE